MELVCIGLADYDFPMYPRRVDVPVALIEALADRYRLDRQLGAGGMATVYLARDVKHDREVAIDAGHGGTDLAGSSLDRLTIARGRSGPHRHGGG